MVDWLKGGSTLKRSGRMIPADLPRIDIDPRIKFCDPAVDAGTTFFAVQGTRYDLKKEPSIHVDFKCYDQPIRGQWCYINKGGGIGAGDTEIPVDDGAGGCGTDHILKGKLVMALSADMTTKEIMYITDYDATKIVVNRAQGEGSAQTWPDDQALLILAHAGDEPDTIPELKSLAPEAKTNYCQTFITPMGLSRRAQHVTFHTQDPKKELQKLRRENWIEHVKEASKAFIWGEKYYRSSDGMTTTRGLWQPIVQDGGYTKNVNGNLTHDLMLEIIRNAFYKGSETKIALCSPLVLDCFSAFKKTDLEMRNSEQRFNLKVSDYTTGHGHLVLMCEKQLQGDPSAPTGMMGGAMIIYDPENVAYKYIEDSHLIQDVQLGTNLGKQDIYLTDAGLKLRIPESHAAVWGITGWQ